MTAQVANGDGVVNIEDLLAVLGSYGSKNQAVDIVNSGDGRSYYM